PLLLGARGWARAGCLPGCRGGSGGTPRRGVPRGSPFPPASGHGGGPDRMALALFHPCRGALLRTGGLLLLARKLLPALDLRLRTGVLRGGALGLPAEEGRPRRGPG